jgi:hypothetical protein
MPIGSILKLVGGFNPSEKYESQLGSSFPIYGNMFQTTNQEMLVQHIIGACVLFFPKSEGTLYETMNLVFFPWFCRSNTKKNMKYLRGNCHILAQ